MVAGHKRESSKGHLLTSSCLTTLWTTSVLESVDHPDLDLRTPLIELSNVGQAYHGSTQGARQANGARPSQRQPHTRRPLCAGSGEKMVSRACAPCGGGYDVEVSSARAGAQRLLRVPSSPTAVALERHPCVPAGRSPAPWRCALASRGWAVASTVAWGTKRAQLAWALSARPRPRVRAARASLLSDARRRRKASTEVAPAIGGLPSGLVPKSYLFARGRQEGC